MPPIASQNDEHDVLFDRLSSSVVTVFRKENNFDEFGPGIIIDYDAENTYVRVDSSNVKDEEELTVTFSDNTTHRACVFLNTDIHTVLVVKSLTAMTRSKVIFCEGPIKRETIFTIARVEADEGLGLMTGNVITPDCTALKQDGSLIVGSGDLFAISCPAGGISKQRSRGNASRIVGAAVFNMDGQVIGPIKSISAFDVKYCMKLSSFLDALEQSLQALNSKILLSRSENVSGMESSTAGDRMSKQKGTTSSSGSTKRSLEHVPVSDNKTETELHTHQLGVTVKFRRPKAIRQPLMRLSTRVSEEQVAKMLSERGVSSIFSNRKRKFDSIDGVLGHLHPASPHEEEEFGSSSDSGLSGWSIHSRQVALNWDQSVVSLTSLDEGGSIHPACTGIVFHNTKTRAYLLTSASLFRFRHDRLITFRREAKVRLPNDQVVNGIPIFHSSKSNLSVVSVLPEGCLLRAACLDRHQQQLQPHSQVVSVRRCFDSGKLIDTAGILEEAAAEGLLTDSLGNIVGFNCYAKQGTTFVPMSTILKYVAAFQEARARLCARDGILSKLGSLREHPMKKFGMEGRAIKLKAGSPSHTSPSHMSGLEGSSKLEKKKQSACDYCDPEGQSAPGDRFKRLFFGRSWPAGGDDVSRVAWLRSRCYPIPALYDGGMRMLCDFEEKFAEDIWSKLTKQVASNLSQCVVALASFSGDKRFFACTGIVIGCNEATTRVLTSASLVRNSDDESKVADNLKIEVCLPDNEHATGTLQNYNLCYNVATITIMGSHCTQTLQIYDQLQTEPSGEVAAVGRVYESGKLIATGGNLIDKPSELDCKELKMSTCKITKAGIGGPLIDSDGNFMGMDFYGLEETPYLPRNVVLDVLRSFDAKPDATMISDHDPNRWPVPKPFWCYPVWHIYMGEGVNEDDLPRPKWKSLSKPCVANRGG